ncbi:MAG: DUF6057 family protein [Phycisphaerae bacterium]|nr:DUF6057 family protein [Phycisphaerae bacterium]
MAFFHSLLLCSLFLYIWLFGNTRLIYHAFGRFVDYPVFFTGWEFFRGAIDHPGGVVEYVTGFLSQFYYYPLGGAIVITIVISLTCLATAMLVRFAGFNSLAGIVGYTPAIFFLAMHSQCEHPLGVFVALLLNLWALVAYEKIRQQSIALRCCLFMVMFVLLYLAAGACAFLFGILAAVYELFIRRSFLSAGLYILLTGLLPLAVGWCFDMRLMDIYLYSLPFDPRVSLDAKTAKALYISILCILSGVFVCQFFISRKKSAEESVKKSKQTSVNTIKTWLRWLKFSTVPVVVVLAAIVTVNRSTGIEKLRLQADFYAGNNMWTELLEYANRFPIVSRDPEGNHNIIQALHHTGRLGEELFRYPQFKEGMFLPPRGGNSVQESTQGNIRGYRRGISIIRLSLLLGRVNVAEKDSYELLENVGECPEILRYLAIINIAKGQPETARVFLEVLSGDLIHGAKAKSTLKRLDEDPELSDDAEIVRLRSVMLTKDITADQSLGELMSDLLEVNPHNRLAFEYMMLYYLKSKEVDKIAHNMYRFGNFGYKKVPRHYGEAILLHLGNTRERIKTYGWKIDPQTYKTGDRFMAALKFNPVGQPSSARNLAPEFGSTYFYYYIFSQSGSGL